VPNPAKRLDDLDAEVEAIKYAISLPKGTKVRSVTLGREGGDPDSAWWEVLTENLKVAGSGGGRTTENGVTDFTDYNIRQVLVAIRDRDRHFAEKESS
jgi:hypothetical protein